MSNIEDAGNHSNKNRKRSKRLCQQIREQVEFYLSDTNLQKDRFFRQEMNNSPNGYIDLELFLRCNKIRAMTSDIDVLTSAVSTSKKLLVKKEEKKVARLLPYTEPKDVDERTVYVECLPSGIDREWIRNLFSSCGHVIYISLPKFKSTNDIKGFAFVEFETTEAASKACELMNHPPAEALEKVGKFPRSKQLKELEKQVKIRETGRKRRASESEIDNEPPSRAKRKRTLSEGKNDEAELAVSVDVDSSEKQEPQISRRKGGKSSENLGTKEQQPSESKSSSKIPATSLKYDKVENKKNAAKQSDEKLDHKNIDKKGEESDDAETSSRTKISSSKKFKKDETKETSDFSATGLKRKASKDMESGEKKIKRVKICEEPKPIETETDGNGDQKEGTKRKCHKKNKSKTKAKDIPELRVIPKIEWLKHRTEYLQIQKENMSQLKEKLKQLKNDESKANGVNKKMIRSRATRQTNVTGTTRKPEPEFIANVVVKVTTEQTVTRKDLKERIWAMGSIAYIDFKDGDSSGHIRCNDAETASAISEMTLQGFIFQQLSGEDEQNYWLKLKDDRNKKLNSKSHPKQRGRDKILHKADVAYEKMKKPLHIIFD